MNERDEAKIILTFLLKRSGKTQVKEAELYLPLSLELKWFTSSQASQFVQYALQNKLLEKKDNLVTPTFDVSAVSIPVGFKPSTSTFTSSQQPMPQVNNNKPSDLSKELVNHLCQHTQKEKQQLDKEIQQLIKEKNITYETALLLYGYNKNISIDNFIEQVEETLTIKNEG